MHGLGWKFVRYKNESLSKGFWTRSARPTMITNYTIGRWLCHKRLAYQLQVSHVAGSQPHSGEPLGRDEIQLGYIHAREVPAFDRSTLHFLFLQS